MVFCYTEKHTQGLEGNGRSEAEAKNHPVNGFLVPRAGGGTVPVTPGAPEGVPNKTPSKWMVFCYAEKHTQGLEGNGRSEAEAKNHPVKI